MLVSRQCAQSSVTWCVTVSRSFYHYVFQPQRDGRRRTDFTAYKIVKGLGSVPVRPVLWHLPFNFQPLAPAHHLNMYIFQIKFFISPPCLSNTTICDCHPLNSLLQVGNTNSRWLKSALVCDVTQLAVVISYRRFGTTYQVHLQWPWPVKLFVIVYVHHVKLRYDQVMMYKSFGRTGAAGC
jgi:hypothetical protein